MPAFDEARKTEYLNARRDGKDISKAADIAGVTTKTVYNHLNADTAFAEADKQSQTERAEEARKGYIPDSEFQEAAENALMHNLKANNMSAVRFTLPKIAKERWGDNLPDSPESQSERADKMTAFLATFNEGDSNNGN